MESRTLKRLVVLLGVIVLVVVIQLLDLGQYFTLAQVKGSQARLAVVYAEHRVTFMAGYIGLYVLSTALSLPWASLLTMLGGAVFGFWPALVLVSLSSTVGATLACAASRFVLRDWVQRRLGERLRTVDEGIAREGAFYLFTLRLIPLFPFWMINLAMGLTRIPLRTYYWVSQLGMLPGTAVYVNAGKELGKIDSLSGILSPSLIASFAILGLFPIVVKKLMGVYRSKAPRRET